MKAMYEEWTKLGRAGIEVLFPPIHKKNSTTNHVSSVTNLECMKSTESCSVPNVSKTEQSSLSVQTLQDQETPTDSRQYDLSPPDSNAQFSQTLLWIQQEEWQQNLMVRYGNTMSLIDATYQTTKYDLPLFQKVAFEYRINTAFLSRSTHFFVAFLPFGKQTSQQ